MQVTCTNDVHDDEEYTWDYSGDSNEGEYVTCPKCHRRIKIGGQDD